MFVAILKRRVLTLVTLMSLFAVPLAFSDATAQGSAVDPLGPCVTKYTAKDRGLHRGQVRRQIGGLTVVGGQGLTVSVSGTRSGPAAVDVAMGSDADVDGLARAYAAAGRSVLDDARAAGVGAGLVRRLCAKARAQGNLRLMSTSGSGKIIGSSCVHDTVGYVEWDGCVTRYRATADGDPNWNYGVDDAQAWGHETDWEPWEDLHKGGVRNSYGTSRVDILKASPSADLSDVNRCYNQSFGVSAGGFGVSAGGTVCPARWNITRTGVTSVPEYHKVQWEGQTNDDREAVAVSAFRYRAGYSTEYHLGINWDVH